MSKKGEVGGSWIHGIDEVSGWKFWGTSLFRRNREERTIKKSENHLAQVMLRKQGKKALQDRDSGWHCQMLRWLMRTEKCPSDSNVRPVMTLEKQPEWSDTGRS